MSKSEASGEGKTPSTLAPVDGTSMRGESLSADPKAYGNDVFSTDKRVVLTDGNNNPQGYDRDAAMLHHQGDQENSTFSEDDKMAAFNKLVQNRQQEQPITPESKDRQARLRHFTDQGALDYEENIPEPVPFGEDPQQSSSESIKTNTPTDNEEPSQQIVTTTKQEESSETKTLDLKSRLQKATEQKAMENIHEQALRENARFDVLREAENRNSQEFQGGKSLSEEGRAFFDREQQQTGETQINQTITSTTLEKRTLTKEQITEQMIAINKVFEQILILQKNNPYSSEVTTMLQSVQTMIENINIAQSSTVIKRKESYTVPGSIEQQSQYATPYETPYQPPQEPERTPEQDRKERNIKKGALIAGAIAGGATSTIGGLPVAGIASLAITGVGAVNRLTRYIGGRRIAKLQTQLATETNPAERTRLERNIRRWKNVRKGTEYVKEFVRGYGYGLLAGSLISGVFMGGQGLINKPWIEPGTVAPSSSGLPPKQISPKGRPSITQSRVPNTPAPTTTPSISPGETGLIQNGRVNLPGSTWNGNPGGAPTENIRGLGELLHTNFTGGQYNMAAHHLNKDMANAGLKLVDLTDKVGTDGVHQLLNGYLNQIQSGVTNPSLTGVLQSSGLEGASEVLSMIK